MLYPYSYASYPQTMSMGYYPPSPYGYAGVSVPMAQTLYYPSIGTPAPHHTPSSPILTSAGPAQLPAARPMSVPSRSRHVHFPHPKTPEKPDLLEETALRYFGFTDEIGESWHDVIVHYVPQIKNKLGQLSEAGKLSKSAAQKLSDIIPTGKTIYNWSYYLTGAYIGVDALHKAYKAYEYHQDQPTDVQVKSALAQGAKTFAFQMLASYAAPLFLVKNFRELIKHGLEKLPANNALLPKGGLGRLYLPAVLCTVLLPVIATPIDKAVHHSLDWAFKWLGWDKYATFRNDADGSGKPE